MSEISIDRIIRFIQELVSPPYFLTTRWGHGQDIHLEVRYLDISDCLKSSLLHETIHLLHMHTSEEVRERLNEELLAVAAYTKIHSELLFALCFINETPVRIKLLQNEAVACQAVIRTEGDLMKLLRMVDSRWMKSN